jgi:benzoate membrane transport protein
VASGGGEFRRSLPALYAAIPVVIIYFAVLGIVLTAAGPTGLDLTDAQASGWIAVLYGWPTALAVVLTIRYRQPLLLTGNIFAIIFFVSLGDRLTFPELAGAAIVAGAILLLMSILGLTGRVADWIPAPIVQGLIAGAVMPFVVGIFSALSTSNETGRIPVEVPIMVGSAVLAYLVSQARLGTRIPPILPAFLVGLAVAATTGQVGTFSPHLAAPTFEFVTPEFSWTAIATVTPVLLALMTVQANIPSVIYLQTQGYDPPERQLNLVSGAGTMLGSLFGPITIVLALPPVLLSAGPAAGDRPIRYRSVYLPVVAGILIAILASTAADLAVLVPPVLLLTMAGLALVPALTVALREVTRGPLFLGPLCAFAIALSDISVLGLGPFFWSLVGGTLISLVFEREGWKELAHR